MTWLVILAACVAFALGIAFGMSLQWRRNQAYITRLEAQVVELQIRVWKPIFDADSDDDDFDEQDQFDMDEMQMRQTGAHE